MILALGLLLVALPVAPAPAQTSTAPQAAPAPRAEPAPRPRPRDARDRAYMDGGIAITPGFSGSLLGQGMPPAPQAQLAPRPNLDIEARPVAPSQSPTLTPTMIHPRVPSRSAATDPAPTHPDQRLLQTPAPGARLNVPLTW